MSRPRAVPAPRTAGFTLVELVLVLMLISIMVSIIAPVLTIPPSRLVANDATMLATHLELARTEALSNRRLVQVEFDTVAASYTAYADHDGNGTIGSVTAEALAFPEFGTRELSDQVTFGRGSSTALPADASAAIVALPGGSLVVNDQGIPDPWGTMGNVYLVHATEPTAVAAVAISSSGSFKVWRWDEGSSSWR